MQLESPGARAGTLEAIAFGFVGSSGEAPMNCGAQVQLVYRLEINEYRGLERVQLNCQHLKPR